MALFQRRRALRAKTQDRQWGLVTGPRAIIITKPGAVVDGVRQPDEVVFDGVRELERQWLANGPWTVEFEDDDET